LFKQYFQYGFWRIPVMRKHRRPTSVRQIIPLLFYLTVLVLLIAGIVLQKWWLAVALPGIYVSALVLSAAWAGRHARFQVGARLAIAFATIHAGYAGGWAYGFWSLAFNRNAWQRHTQRPTLSR